MAGTKISALTAATSIADTDVLAGVQSSTTKKFPFSVIRDEIRNQARWKLIATSKYTALPPSTSTITMSDTSDFAVGSPVKYTYGGTTYYGIVTAITTNSLLTIAGAPLNTGTSLTALYVGRPEMAIQIDLFVTSTYGSATGDLLASLMNAYFQWTLPKAYLVSFQAAHKIPAGTTQPKINVKINGSAVSTNDTNNGIQLSSNAGQWVANSAVAISTAAYDINRGEALELNCTVVGVPTSGAQFLTVTCTFVME